MKGETFIIKTRYKAFPLLFSAFILLQSVIYAQTVTTFAGTGTAGFSGDGGPATAAKFANNSPVGVAVDAAGNVYVVDDNNNRIRKINTSDTISTFIGSTENYTGDGGQYTNALIAIPYGVAIDATGNIYLAVDNVIRKINTSGIITTFAGNLTTYANFTASNQNNGSQATAASFAEVTGVAVDDSGNVYIVDQNANTILRVNKVTGIISIVAGGGSGGDGGLATNASLSSPKAVVVDAAQNIYIADYGHNSVRKVTASTGIISTVASVTSATSLAFDNAGNLYISSPYYSIKKLDTAGNLTTWLSYSGYSSGLAFDNNNNLYIADQVAKKVMKVLPPCTSVAAGNISNLSSNSICTSGSSSLSLTGESVANGISYQWQSSSNGITWTNVGADSTTYSTGTLTATTYYRNIVTCATASLYDTTQTDTITVSTPVAPTVSISSSSGSSICVGTNVTFTATTTSGGTAPAYQWTKDGNNLPGATDSTYTDNGLNTNDVLACLLTSNATCVTTTTATSNTITMAVTSNVTPAVTISTGVSDTICAGTALTFTAAPNGGGGTPAYQWEKNGNAVAGATNLTYTDNGLNDSDAISCILTSNATCATTNTVTSNTLTITVNPVITPTVNISASTADTICTGTGVTFTAVTTNSGTNLSYQWTKNGPAIAGATNATYTDNGLNNNDVIACVVTGNASCATSNVVTSNAVTMTVNRISTPTISISSNHNSVCLGTAITFTAVTTYGGTNPTYQWMDNGTAISGATSSSYTGDSINNNDQIYCVLTSNSTAPCAATNMANSDTLTMTILSSAAPVITFTSSTGSDTACAGSSVTFTASATNMGATGSYFWYKNGSLIASNLSNTYTFSNMSGGDAVYCKVFSANLCNPSAISDTITMVIMPAVLPFLSIATSTTIICAGTPATFTTDPINGGTNPSYQWSVNGVTIADTGVTYTDSNVNNNDVIYCTLTSSEACAAATPPSNTIAMTVNPLVTPTVSISANPGDTICAGISVIFTATSTNGGGTPVYEWTKNAVTVGNDSVYTDTTVNNNDVVICELTSNAACAVPDTASDTLTVTVHALPTPVITANNNVLHAGVFTTYQWNDTAIIAGATDSTYTPTHNGSYTVTVTDSNGCSATSAVYNETILGIANINSGYAIRIYPNPSNGIVYIDAPVSVTADLSSIDGKTILHQENATTVDMSNLATGMYLITVYNKDRSVMKIEKLVKE